MRFPKTPSTESAAFRRLAAGEDCLMRVPSVCNHNAETTVLAHSNAQSDGKGMGYKSSDHRAVFACYSCHAWLDQGAAGKSEKIAAFKAAQARMIQRLCDIEACPSTKIQKTRAARWALDLLLADNQAVTVLGE